MRVRTRMAPSPTGEYHIGHIRTVLYNYALARKNNGWFIIRIEDTDRKRFVEGAAQRILRVIEDYGLKWDEGPYFQSERLEIYKKHALELVDKEKAYYCFCPEDCDKKCLALSKKEITDKLDQKLNFVIRLKVPKNKKIVWNDEVYGEIVVESEDINNAVLIKSDGYPTYHFAVVVDDHLMEITHVMRGNDWLSSTPKHILLYKYFGWELPVYIHLPNIKEFGDTKKLSKRFGSVTAEEFLEEGYLPEAVLNFLMFLGWNSGGEKEIYSLEEFIEEFSIEKIHKTDLVAFDREKLLWYNGYYIRNIDEKDLLKRLISWAGKYNVDLGISAFDTEYVVSVLKLVSDRMKLFKEFTSLTSYFFLEPKIDANKLLSFSSSKNLSLDILNDFLRKFQGLESDWIRESIDKCSHEILSAKDYKPKKALMTVRFAITGEHATPPLFDVLELIGKQKVLNRLEAALTLIK